MFEVLYNKKFKSMYCSSIQIQHSVCGKTVRCPTQTEQPIREGFTEEVTSEPSFV